jgi:hypothetical protein
MKVDERKKALELSKNWLKEEVKNSRSTQPAISGKASPYRTRLALLISIAAIIVGTFGFVLVHNYSQRDSDKQKNTVNPQSIASPGTLISPPTASGPSFPATANFFGAEQPAPNSDEKGTMSNNNYPSGWPEELLYPAKFHMLEANTIRIPDKYLPAYGVKMRYEGDMNSAAEAFSSYFATRGWQVADRTELDSGALHIRITRNNGRDNGEVTIDTYPGESGKVRIVAIVYI